MKKKDEEPDLIMLEKESFTLHSSSGSSVTVALTDFTELEKMDAIILPTTNAQKAINTIRKMLRDKKKS